MCRNFEPELQENLLQDLQEEQNPAEEYLQDKPFENCHCLHKQ
jgi:hypothetical protein